MKTQATAATAAATAAATVGSGSGSVSNGRGRNSKALKSTSATLELSEKHNKKETQKRKKNLSSIAVALALGIAAAAAAADPIRKFNYICATDTSCYAAAAGGASYCCCYLDFRNRQGAQSNNNSINADNCGVGCVRSAPAAKKHKLYALIVMVLYAFVCVCFGIGAFGSSRITSEMLIHIHTHANKLLCSQRSFALKVFLYEFRAPLFFCFQFMRDPKLRDPSAHTVSYTYTLKCLVRLLTKSCTGDGRAKTKIKLIRNKYCAHARTPAHSLRMCVCVRN